MNTINSDTQKALAKLGRSEDVCGRMLRWYSDGTLERRLVHLAARHAAGELSETEFATAAREQVQRTTHAIDSMKYVLAV